MSLGRVILLFITVSISVSTKGLSQDFAGEWTGSFISENGAQIMSTLTLTQRSNSITGILILTQQEQDVSYNIKANYSNVKGRADGKAIYTTTGYSWDITLAKENTNIRLTTPKFEIVFFPKKEANSGKETFNSAFFTGMWTGIYTDAENGQRSDIVASLAQSKDTLMGELSVENQLFYLVGTIRGIKATGIGISENDRNKKRLVELTITGKQLTYKVSQDKKVMGTAVLEKKGDLPIGVSLSKDQSLIGQWCSKRNNCLIFRANGGVSTNETSTFKKDMDNLNAQKLEWFTKEQIIYWRLEGKNDIKVFTYLIKGNELITKNIQNGDNEETIWYRDAPPKEKNPPVITIISPNSKSLTIESLDTKISLVGRVQDDTKIDAVLINNRPVSLEDGVFSAEQSLSSGENVFTIKATDVNGNTASKQVTINGKYKQAIVNEKDKRNSTEPLIKGRYFALLIANQDYKDISKLNFPVKDAQRLKDVLERKYQFNEVKLVINQSTSQIAKELEQYSKTLEEDDNLLIFYSGHGQLVKETDRGYLLGIDSKKDDRTTWLAHDEFAGYIKAIQIKHTLLILDACYAGKIIRTQKNIDHTLPSLEVMLRSKSRNAMTSGDLTEVPDASAFNRYLIQKLNENTKPFLSDGDLFYSFKEIVINNTPKSPDGSIANPQFAPIPETGHDGGSFIFILKK